MEMERLLGTENEPFWFLDGRIDLPQDQPTQESELPFLKPGTLLCNRYEVDQLIDHGGMGAVYKARDIRLSEGGDEILAVKIILPKLSDRPDLLRRFKQEILLTRRVTHSNVIRVHNFEQDNEIVFFTMEFIGGNDLATLLEKRSKYPPREAAEIMYHVARGIQAAHEKQVIHRDLKPRNIMIEKGGRVVVMDFGLARGLQRESGTVTQVIMGTPGYIAPEILTGHSDYRSDLYSLGVTFYELLTGQLPQQGSSVLRGASERSAQLSSQALIPHALHRIIRRCLEAEPNNRYQSATDVAADLDRWLNPPPTFLGVRRDILLPAAGLCALLMLMVGVFILRQRTPPPLHPDVSLLIADFDNQTGDPVFSGGTLESVLGISLESASFITTYDRARAHKTARQLSGADTLNQPLATEIATREGIQDIVVGSLTQAGSAYNLSVRVIEAGSAAAVVSPHISANSKEEVLASIGKIGASIRKALGESRAPTQKPETFTAASLEAIHAYAVAQDLALKGNGTQALPEYRRAIELDPHLGRAYAGLAAFYRNNNQTGEALKWYRQALAHSNRMTDREKYRTRGGFYVTEGKADKAVEEFTDLVKRYPADNAGFANLALAWFMKRDFAKALQYGRQAIQIYPKNVVQRNNIAFYSMYAGDFPAAIREADDALVLNPAYEKSYIVKALSELAQENSDAARKNYQQLETLGASGASLAALGLADIDAYEGRPQDGVEILRRSLETDIATQRTSLLTPKLVALAQCYLLIGNTTAALETAQKAITADKSASILLPLARIYMNARRPEKAKELADELHQSRNNDDKAYANLIEGEIRLQAGDTEHAITQFNEAQRAADTWLGHFDLGRAYVMAGESAEADSDLETSMRRRGEATALFLDDLPSYRYFPPVYYYLARAEEGLKSPAALEQYRNFLRINDTRGRDPLVSDARRRLNVLLAAPGASAQQ